MRTSIGLVIVLTSACGARSYVPASVRENLNAGVTGVSLDLVAGDCELSIGAKGDEGRYVWHPPMALCTKSKAAKVVVASVPRVPLVQPAPPPAEHPAQ